MPISDQTQNYNDLEIETWNALEKAIDVETYKKRDGKLEEKDDESGTEEGEIKKHRSSKKKSRLVK